MKELLTNWALPSEGKTVCDVGSRQTNRGKPTYRLVTLELGFVSYVGIDIVSGRNVNVVVPEEGEWDLSPFDIVVSGQCLEHVCQPWIWIRQIYSITKKGGLVFIIVPSKGPEHRYPVDCWRVFPDGMRSLLEWGGFDICGVGLKGPDCFGVGVSVG